MDARATFTGSGEKRGNKCAILPIRREPTIEDLRRVLSAVAALFARGYSNTIIDLTDIQALCPGCAAYLSAMKRELDAAGGELTLRVKSEEMRELLAMHGLARSVEVEAAVNH